MTSTIVEVTVRLKVFGLPGQDSEAFAVECVEDALENSDEIQRCFPDVEVEVVGSWSKEEGE